MAANSKKSSKTVKKKDSKMTDIVEKKTTEIAATSHALNAWGAPKVSRKDTIVPKILLQQGMSEFVTSGRAKLGDFVENIGGKVLGGFDKPLAIIPILAQAVFQEWRGEGDAREYIRTVPVETDPASSNYNDELPWEFQDEEGNACSRDRVIQVYALLPDEVAALPMALPYVIAFKSTSRRAGQMVMTQMYQTNRAAGKVPPAVVMTVSSSSNKNDKKQVYAVAEASALRDSTEKEVNAAFAWYQSINGGKVKVKEEQESSDSDATAFPHGANAQAGQF